MERGSNVLYLLATCISQVNVIDKVQSDIPSMAVIYCKKCLEYRYLTPHAFWNVKDLGVKCDKCKNLYLMEAPLSALSYLVDHTYSNK